jgi:hypothetical protein
MSFVRIDPRIKILLKKLLFALFAFLSPKIEVGRSALRNSKSGRRLERNIWPFVKINPHVKVLMK